MVYSEDLADRVRATLGPRTPFDERKMFGGLAFLVGMRMAVAVAGNDLMVRVGTDGLAAALDRGAGPMAMGGRTMSGWVLVDGAQVADPDDLDAWLTTGVEVARAEPPRSPR
ncbi:TfoX/Sxy family protein [Cellulosimicrobium funkei]|uniref:TfoX/Sxy family protein n=1 Tax=Cellulosimicrobium funkei TaxID=264251 RepID=UPI003757B683